MNHLRICEPKKLWILRHAASVCALMLAGAAPAWAAPDCANPGTQREMNECATQAFKREDTRLNRLYTELSGRSSKAELARLKQAQLAWIKFRDLHCAYEGGRYDGGSMEALVHANCLASLTVQRNETLVALIKDAH